MSTWAITFLLFALISGLLGFAGFEIASAPLARLLFNLFLTLFLGAVFLRNVWHSGAYRAWREDD